MKNVKGKISPAPKDPSVLQNSIAIKGTSSARVAVDPKNDQIVMFRLTERKANGVFEYHGYVSSWKDLSQKAKNILRQNELVDKKGGIK